MKLNLKPFKTELGILLSVILRNPIIDVLHYVHLKSKDGVCTLTTSNLNEFGRLTVPCGETFEILLPPESLKELDLEIEIGEKVTVNGISYPISTDDFVVFPEVAETFDIDFPRLVSLFPLVDSDQFLPFTQGLNFVNGKAWVSNGHYLVDMPAPNIVGILSKVPKLKQGKIGATDNHFTIQSGNLTYLVRKVGGNSPDMDAVTPKSDKFETVSFDRDDLKKALVKLEAVYKKSKKEQKFSKPLIFQGGKITCIGDNVEGSVVVPFVGLVPPFGLNPYYLSGILEHCPQRVTFKFFGGLRPILIQTDHVVLIMPVNIGDYIPSEVTVEEATI